MCARHGRGTIEICLSEKRALAKKDWETLLSSVAVQKRLKSLVYVKCTTFSLLPAALLLFS